MTKEEIAAVLAEHKAWRKNKGGKRADLARADLAGADLAGADLAGADLAGANLAGAYLAGADLAGAYLAGADLAGAKINDKTVIGILRRAMRSDGYEFFLWHCQEGYYVKAGCRFLGMEAARQHWISTRQGTALGDESLDILDFFDAAIKRQGGAA